MGAWEGGVQASQPLDTAPWFMSNCQPQSCFPPGQSRLQWASGEVACPATMFIVLRRHWEPDLGRPGWAAPRGPSRVHTHFPETEHGRPPASLSSATQLPSHPPTEDPASHSPAPGWLQNVNRAQGARAGPGGRGCKGREEGASSLQTDSCCPLPLSRHAHPGHLRTDWLLHGLSLPDQSQQTTAHGPNPTSHPPPVSKDCLLYF